ncbi:MAG: sulfurtransferase TusA family protein [Pseudomonadota bacterium]
MTQTETIDALGLLCPLPVLKLRKRIKPLKSGQIIELMADDPAAVVDVPHYCAEAGHELVEVAQDGAVMVFRVRKS